MVLSHAYNHWYIVTFQDLGGGVMGLLEFYQLKIGNQTLILGPSNPDNNIQVLAESTPEIDEPYFKAITKSQYDDYCIEWNPKPEPEGE